MKTKALGLILIGIVLIIVAPKVISAFAEPAYAKSTLTIDTANGQHFPFTIEVARTPHQMEHGLMFRRQMAENAGMLFIFSPVQPVSMWMKNTYLPLDMLFASTDGTITKVFANAVPESTDIISSNGEVKYVVELNAGIAAKLGIQAGDKLSSPEFGQ